MMLTILFFSTSAQQPPPLRAKEADAARGQEPQGRSERLALPLATLQSRRQMTIDKEATICCGCNSRVALLQGDGPSLPQTDDIRELRPHRGAIYEPVIESLRVGLAARAAACKYWLLPVAHIGCSQHGRCNATSGRRCRCEYPCALAPEDGSCSEGRTVQEWLERPLDKRAPESDVVIHVGELGMKIFSSSCAQNIVLRGAKCVLFWTEPKPVPLRIAHNMQEIWFYSRRVLNITKHDLTEFGHNTTLPILRFVPPGFVKPAWMNQSGIAGVSNTSLTHAPVREVLLLGHLQKEAETRRTCYHKLEENPLVGPRLRNRYDLWSDDDWRRFAPSLKSTAFVNLPRRAPYAEQNLGTLRVAMLLSMEALIVTAQVAEEDLSEYKDMLLVEPSICDGRWSKDVESLLFNNDSTALGEWRARAAQKFRHRFSPVALLHRAGVWDVHKYQYGLPGQQWSKRHRRSISATPRAVLTVQQAAGTATRQGASCLIEGRVRALAFTRVSEGAYALPPIHKLLSLDKVLEERWLHDIAKLRVQTEYCATQLMRCASSIGCPFALHSSCAFSHNAWLDCRNNRSLPCAIAVPKQLKEHASRVLQMCLKALQRHMSLNELSNAEPQMHISILDAAGGSVTVPAHSDSQLDSRVGFSLLLELTEPAAYVGSFTSYHSANRLRPVSVEHQLGSITVHNPSTIHTTSPLVAGRRAVLVCRFLSSSLSLTTDWALSHAGSRTRGTPCCPNQLPERLSPPPTEYLPTTAITASHPLAKVCGEGAMQRGGSAVDAAVAANLCQSVADPYNCGVGGDLFALVSFKGKTYGLNGSGRSPRALSLAAARADGLHAASAHSITVPGAVDGWERLWRRFGKLPWSDLFKDAIYHAKHGHIPTQVEANMALAATLERLAVGGAAEFYRGSLADDLLRDTRRLGSLLNASDLASHAGEDITPISTTYRGYRVWELQSNSQGLTALEALNVLENFNMSTLEFLSATHLHHMIEATKLAFADRALFSGDGMAINSSKWHRATQRLLSKRYAARLSRTISSTGHKRRSMDNTIRPDQYAFNGARLQPNGDTISIVAGDEDGIMISLMQSNFNSKFMLETLGFVLHNRGNLFSLGESSPDLYAPGSRPFHTLTPALVTVRTGHGIGERPWLAFGMTGGSTQPVGHLQLLTNIIDFGLPLQAAIDAPRFTHWHPNQPSGYWTEPHWQPAGWQLAGGSPSGSMGTAGFVQLEALHPCLSASVRSALAAFGHLLPVTPRRSMCPGRMQAIEVVGDPQTHSRPNFKLQGYRVGSDRRG